MVVSDKSISAVTILGLCAVLAVSLLTIPVTNAVTVWSDNFNDGDYNGWTVETGSFSAASNNLAGTTSADWNIATHASNVATGTWSFDLSLVDTYVNGGGEIFFMGNDLDSGNNNRPRNAYLITISLGRFLFESLVSSARNQHAVYTPAEIDGEWHVDITRDADGFFNIWFNGVHRIARQNTNVNVSTHFVVNLHSNQQWIDNIVVSNTVDVTPPTTDPTTTPSDDTPPPGIPGFPIVAIAIGLMAAISIGILVRRKTTQ